MMNLLISKDCDCRVPRKQLNIILTRAIEQGDLKPDSQIQLFITDDHRMRDLNRRFRGVDSITDVLTFTSEIPNQVFLGDIVIDIQQAARQKENRSLADELVELFIHGFIHLIGYDHIRNADRDRMLKKENEYRSIIKER